MAILTKTAITSILIGDSVDPTIANLPHTELETNIDNLIDYLKNSSVGAFEYDSVTSTGLNFDYEGGTYENRNVPYVITSGSRSLSASVTSYIEINTSAGTITHNASGFTAANIPLWEVTTDGSSITGVIDRRTSFGVRNTLGIDDQATSAQITVDDTNTTFTNIPVFNGGTSGASAPFTVDSTFVVANLNADLLDGQEGSYYATASHIHNSFDRSSSVLSGANVFSNIVVTDGIVTAIATRALTPANIGAQSAGTYNTIIGTDTDINTSGATIIDYITVTDGVITAMGTRVLTADDIGSVSVSQVRSASSVNFYRNISASNNTHVVYDNLIGGRVRGTWYTPSLISTDYVTLISAVASLKNYTSSTISVEFKLRYYENSNDDPQLRLKVNGGVVWTSGDLTGGTTGTVTGTFPVSAGVDAIITVEGQLDTGGGSGTDLFYFGGVDYMRILF